MAAPPIRTQKPPVLSGTSVVSAPILGSALPFGPLVPRTRLNAVSAPPAWAFIGPAGVLNAGGAIGAASQTVSGRVADMAVDPSDPNTFYVAAAGGGVWKTTNGGGSYVSLTDYLGDTAMGSITVANSQPSMIYAGTGEANNSGDSRYGIGLLKSTDGGATWSVIPGPPDSSGLGAFVRRAISRIVVDPTDSNTVYLAIADFAANGLGGNTGVWKTTDGGNTWTNTTADAGLDSFQPYSDLVIDPTVDPAAHHPLTLYAAVGNYNGSTANGIYKTTDGGTTWTHLTTGLPTTNAGRIALTLAPSSPQTLYTSISDDGSTGGNFGALVGLYKTTNGGAAWTQLAGVPNYLGGQGWYDNVVVVSPTNPNAVFAGGVVNYSDYNEYDLYGVQDYTHLDTLIGSTDGGATFNDYSVGKSFIGPHTDLHALTFTADGSRLLDGNDGGVWRLENPYATQPHGPTQDPSDPNNFLDDSNILWTDLNSNLGTIQFVGIALHPTDPKTAYGGSQDNGTEKTTGALPWTQVRDGDGGFVRLDQSNPNTVYHEYYGISLERSDDGGQNWIDLSQNNGINPYDPQPPDGEDPAAFYVPYKLDPANQSRIIYASDHVYESLTKGDNQYDSSGNLLAPGFTAIGTPGVAGYNPNDNIVSTLGVYGSTIYVLAGSSLYATFNDGTLWADRSIPGNPSLGDIYVNPGNPQGVFAVKNSFGGGKVFRSTNGGQNWNDITGNLPDEPFNAIQMDTKTGILYVGGDDGVFSSADYGVSWSRLNTGTTSLPTVQVADLALVGATGLLGVGTHGRGMWTMPLLTVSAPTLLSLTFPTPVAGGTVVTATVTLNTVAPTDTVVGLSSSDSSVVRVFRAVIVPAGATSATFAINTYRSHTTKTVTIQASLNQVIQAAALTITGR